MTPELDRQLRLVKQAVSAAESELRGQTSFNKADRYARQALELSKLPSVGARRKYCARFYRCEHVDAETGVMIKPEKHSRAWSLGDEGLPFWFSLRYSGALATTKPQRNAYISDPTRRHFWAMLAVAAATVQDIRALDPIARAVFSAYGDAPVDVDSQLAEISSQVLDAAELRVEIGDRPVAKTPEGIHSAEVWDRQVNDFDRYVVDPILRRMSALSEYRNRLEAVRVQTELIHRLGNASGIDARLEELVRRSGNDALHAEKLRSASAELREAERARTAAMAEVRGDYLSSLGPS
ncbi:hypothetical protein [Gordonia paraffinivorans]|uniref:hypothetical protein n=1 Tax=Gordonia paraffinivorans TaxID=175628 RepID=UPI003FCDCA1C